MEFARDRLGLMVALATVALAALALGGCGGGDDEGTPVACLEGAGAYERALASAPGEVRLEGTPISECLPRNQAGGELAAVGAALVEAATRLDAEARAEPGGQANVELGYLLGAAQRGAEDTGGIHVDLLRRLEVAARFSPGKRQLPPAFHAAYRRGFDAGRETG